MKYLKWFLKTARPYGLRLAFTMLCHILIAGCAVGFVYVSKKLVDIAVAALNGQDAGNALLVWGSAMAGIALTSDLA